MARGIWEGKKLAADPPPIIYEFLVAQHMGWTMEYVRNLARREFLIILHLCIIQQGVEKTFEAQLATAGMAKKL